MTSVTLGLSQAQVAAMLATALADTPTLEELSSSLVLNQSTISASGFAVVFVAPYSGKLEAASLAVSADVTASDTDYWAVSFSRIRGGRTDGIVQKTTKTVPSLGVGMTAYTDWNFDSSEFHSPFDQFVKGDVLVMTYTKVGSPSNLATPTLTFRAPPADLPAQATMTLLVSDAFNRADTASGTVGSPDIGSAPAAASNMQVLSNALNSTGTFGELAYTAAANVEVTHKITAIATGGIGPMLRYADASNMLYINGRSFYSRIAGTVTSLATPYATAPAVGDTVRAKIVGNDITFSIDRGSLGVFGEYATVTTSLLAGNTKHGIRSTGGANNGADNLTIYGIS